MEHLDFFAQHPSSPYLLLAGLAIFPRLTLLLSSILSGGFLWWLGWFICPHLLVAILATIAYSDTNIVLVVVAWIFALCGSGAEARTVRN